MYLRIASEFSELSKAKRNKVGCIVVKDGNIIAVGYNGTPSGWDNECEDEEGNTHPHVLHAEANAITKLAMGKESSKGATLYCTLGPCFECAKLILQSGIKEVVYAYDYRDLSGVNLLRRGNVPIHHTN